MGINPARLSLEWISASESNKLVNTMKEFINQIKSLGPFPKMEWKEEVEDV